MAWHLTPGEVALAVDTETEKQKDFYRVMAWLIYSGASLTAVGINNPKQFPTLEEAFPSIFEKQEQQNWWITKQRIEAFSKVKKAKEAKEVEKR